MSNQSRIFTKPQAAPFANETELLAFLERPLLARFSSHNPDGTIHIAPLYFLFSDGVFLFGTQPSSRKVRNIMRNPRVSVLVDTDEPVLQSVLAYDQAELDHKDVLKKRITILTKYGYSTANALDFACRLAEAWGSVIVRLQPTKLVTVDYSKPLSIG
jgi:hypothetical protein